MSEFDLETDPVKPKLHLSRDYDGIVLGATDRKGTNWAIATVMQGSGKLMLHSGVDDGLGLALDDKGYVLIERDDD